MDPSWQFRPPVLVGERVVWLGSGSGIPQGGVVKWIGKLPEMGPDWTVGMELDKQLPYGGIDGSWGSRHLFSCKPKHGMLVPIAATLRENDLFRRSRQGAGSSGSSQYGSGEASEHGSFAAQPAPARRRRQQDQHARSLRHTDHAQQLEHAAEQAQQIKQHIQAQQVQQQKQAQKFDQAEQVKLVKHTEAISQLKRREDLNTLKQNELIDQLKQSHLHEQRRRSELSEQLKHFEQVELRRKSELSELVRQAEQSERLKQVELDELLRQSEQDALHKEAELEKFLRQSAQAELLKEVERVGLREEKESSEHTTSHAQETLNDSFISGDVEDEPSAPILEDTLRVLSPTQNGRSLEHDDELPASLQESSDQWSSATESPVPQSPDSRFARGGSRRSQGSGSAAVSEASSYSAASGRSSGDTSEVERLTAQLTMPKGLADFKANLQSTPASEQNNMNTLAVNRLLRRLEAAIAGGQHMQAAGLARDLARQKISCSVTRQRRSLDASPAAIMVDMYVEDKVSHQGPIPLQVIPSMTVAQLKLKVEQELEIPVGVQRWILGKILASDDSKTLEDHNVNASGCPMFLYLVAPDGDQESETGSQPGNNTENLNTAPEEDDIHPPLPPLPAPHGKGWYYNYEEDHYSLCEDSEEDLSDEEVEEMRVLSPAKELPATTTTPSLVQEVQEEEEEEEDDDEEDEEEEEEEEIATIGGNEVTPGNAPATKPTVPQVPRLPGTFSPVAGSSRAEAVPAAKAAEVTAKSPTPTKTENKTGTLKLGWKCPVCTLVNAPTRPGCAACTTERPLTYVVPTEYRANQQEMERLEREQQLDNDMEQATADEKRQVVVDQHQHYMQLVNLDKADLVPNSEAFECSVCLTPYGPNEGTVLRECLHIFCRPCLVNTVQFNQEAEVKCPYRDADYACDSVLQEREIKALVPKQVYEQHLAKSVSQAENKIGNAFHCKTPDCRGWCIFEDNLNEFRCPVCIKTNCLTCQAIHQGINCRQYQEQVKQASETNTEARRTKDMLEEMVDRGEAMKCPTCHVILMKKWGCDWLRCSMCKTEICWVTRGPRWGPGGKGDTTGGCQCGLNGIKCHPRCNYCH